MSDDIQVAVVEDHPSMRSGLELLFAKQGFRVIGSAGSAAAGLTMIEARRPDVAVVDIELGDSSGTELAEAIAKCDPPVAVVLYTGHVEQQLLEDAVCSGALGVVDQAVSNVLRDAPTESERRITRREAEILALLAHGHTSGEAAGELFLSEQTVDTHVRNACTKLGAHGRLHAVVIALGSGDLELGDLVA
jgi:DNA-binding NarL/FixJ family response regulator